PNNSKAEASNDPNNSKAETSNDPNNSKAETSNDPNNSKVVTDDSSNPKSFNNSDAARNTSKNTKKTKKEDKDNTNSVTKNSESLPTKSISKDTSNNTIIDFNIPKITNKELLNKKQEIESIKKQNRPIDLSIIYDYNIEVINMKKDQKKMVEKYKFLFIRVLREIEERKYLFQKSNSKQEIFKRNILIYRKDYKDYIDFSLLNSEEKSKIFNFLLKKFTRKFNKNDFDCEFYFEKCIQKLFCCYQETKEEIREVDDFIFRLLDYIDQHKMTCVYAFKQNVDLDEVHKKIKCIENGEYYNIKDVDICTNIYIMMVYLRVTIDGVIPLNLRKILLRFDVINSESKREYVLRFLPFIVGEKRRKIILRLIDLIWIVKSNFIEVEATDFMTRVLSECIFPLNDYRSNKNRIYACKIVKRLFDSDFYSISPRLYTNATKK
ncbi:hypothetical protein CWI38_1554p0010, partial [Hamiltosporidium tvaerminnensis]